MCMCVYVCVYWVGSFPPFSCFFFCLSFFLCFSFVSPFTEFLNNLCLFCTFKNRYTKFCVWLNRFVHSSLLIFIFSFTILILLFAFSCICARVYVYIFWFVHSFSYDPFVFHWILKIRQHLVFVFHFFPSLVFFRFFLNSFFFLSCFCWRWKLQNVHSYM